MNQSAYKNLNTIYYRGSLRSCNYTCSYCPFRKSFRAEDFIRDQRALEQFCLKAPMLGDNLTVMLIPSGESLIHTYYQKAVARLCQAETIKQVGCQTNLSFSVKDFLAHTKDHSKLRIWCTFHPSQVGLDPFLEQCDRLYQNEISFSVGAVGIPKNVEVLIELRQRLPADTYLWINAMEGVARPYTESEIATFLAIDPLFKFELDPHPARLEHCRGGEESVFVEANGAVFACPISRKKLGNIYSDSPISFEQANRAHCQASHCHCYLAYSNRKDIFNVTGLLKGRTCRIPNRKKAIFFDVDGTLTLSSGEIPDSHIQALERLAQRCELFLATSLPHSYAKQRCKAIWPNIAGGVFAEGSDIRIFTENYKNIIPVDEALLDALAQDLSASAASSIKAYREDGTLHKITLLNNKLPQKYPHFHCVHEGDTWGVVAKEASKLNGILEICRRLDLFEPFVSVVGNSRNDIPMLRYFSNSIAVPTAEPETKNAAKTVCDIQGLWAEE